MIRHGLGSTDDRQVLKYAELYISNILIRRWEP